MNIIHVITTPSIFEEVIKTKAKINEHKTYSLNYFGTSKSKQILEFIKFFYFCLSNKNCFFVFHYVNHQSILSLTTLIPKITFGMIYWGGDFYSYILNENKFQQHCLRKSPYLSKDYYPKQEEMNYVSACIHKLKIFIKLHIGMILLGRSKILFSLTTKQRRIAEYFYRQVKKEKLELKYYPTQGYLEIPQNDQSYSSDSLSSDNELNVLISHSATASVAHFQSLHLLKEYSEKWKVDINIHAFLSYSGGDNEYVNLLEKKISDQEGFKSFNLYRDFFKKEELINILNGLDFAFFSCLRDEGLGLLTEFVNLGGVVSFNQYSMNYDFFRTHSPQKLLSHGVFFKTKPEELIQLRKKNLVWQNDLIDYSDMDKIIRLIHD